MSYILWALAFSTGCNRGHRRYNQQGACRNRLTCSQLRSPFYHLITAFESTVTDSICRFTNDFQEIRIRERMRCRRISWMYGYPKFLKMLSGVVVGKSAWTGLWRKKSKDGQMIMWSVWAVHTWVFSESVLFSRFDGHIQGPHNTWNISGEHTHY